MVPLLIMTHKKCSVFLHKVERACPEEKRAVFLGISRKAVTDYVFPLRKTCSRLSLSGRGILYDLHNEKNRAAFLFKVAYGKEGKA